MKKLAAISAKIFDPAAARAKREYELVLASGLFDPAYYRTHNADIASALDPLKHYLEAGWREGRNPNPFFDTDWYLESYPDVADVGMNPLVHYLRFGGTAGRDPSPLFDSDWYVAEYSDVREDGVNPLVHYLRWGQFESRLPRKPGSGVGRSGGEVLSAFDCWVDLNELTARDEAELRDKLKARSGKLPKISVVTPVYNTSQRLLEDAIASVTEQIYENWELCLVDDASSAPHVRPALKRLAKRDARIKVEILDKNGGISVATNRGVELATGDVIVFFDHDDLLTRDCLAELAIYYADHSDADLVYSDDDKIDVNGDRYAPQFKPDWSPVLLLSWMYISHVFSVRKQLFQKLGGFRSAFDGSQDYDFALRAAEVARHVGHVPKILYHWRAVEGSTASGGDAKPESIARGRRAVEEALKRRKVAGARVVHPEWAALANVGMFDIVFPDEGPRVSIIIPTKDKVGMLRNCLESLRKTTYRNYEILVLDNESREPETIEYLTSVARSDDLRVVRIPSPSTGFSFAHLNNEGAKHSTSDFLLFLNNDTEVINPTWLSQMMGYARLDGVGAVGARLYFEDGTIQHAGILHGCHEGLAGHSFRGAPPHDWGYLGFIRSSREYSAVTAACLLTPRALFEQLGGFDEKNFAVAYNDADYCYRAVESGWSCVYCASAELWHYEGKSRGFEDDPAERANYRRLYGSWVDRWYNPNLSLENEHFEIEAVRPETSEVKPLRLIAVTHNLNNEGAPTTLMDLVVGLKERGFVDPIVLSPSDGPLSLDYEKKGIRVIRLEGLMRGVKDRDTQFAALSGVGMLLSALDADVVLANTLQTYWAVKGAKMAGIPAIWAQHESEPWESYFDFLSPDMRTAAYDAFSDAYRVLYVADATRRAWRAVETRHNFKVIRHGIPADRLAQEVGKWDRGTARRKLGIPDGAFVVSVVGTVCQRKGQIDLVEAYAALPADLQAKTFMFIAGKVAEPEYGQVLAGAIGSDDDHIIVTDHIEDPFVYYMASDVFVCTSRLESAPRVIVEAMACGIPIITTPVFGIPELVRENINALYYEVGDSAGLADAIATLLGDELLRRRLGSNGPKVLAGQPGYEEMVQQYASTIRQAVNLRVTKRPAGESSGTVERTAVSRSTDEGAMEQEVAAV